MNQSRCASLFPAAVAILAGFAAAAQADPLSLVVGQQLVWNRSLQPAISPVWDQAVANDTDQNNLQLTAYTFRVLVRPLAATGTLVIDQPSIGYPTTGSVITANQNPILPVDNLPAFLAFSGFDFTGAGYDVGDGQNLFRMQFTTPDNALGLFELVAVNDDTTDGTGWLESAGNAPQAFSNFPFLDGELQLGTILIVPEPGGLVLAGIAVAGLLIYRRRRRAV
jgi:hypothetical protein